MGCLESGGLEPGADVVLNNGMSFLTFDFSEEGVATAKRDKRIVSVRCFRRNEYYLSLFLCCRSKKW